MKTAQKELIAKRQEIEEKLQTILYEDEKLELPVVFADAFSAVEEEAHFVAYEDVHGVVDTEWLSQVIEIVDGAQGEVVV